MKPKVSGADLQRFELALQLARPGLIQRLGRGAIDRACRALLSRLEVLAEFADPPGAPAPRPDPEAFPTTTRD